MPPGALSCWSFCMMSSGDQQAKRGKKLQRNVKENMANFVAIILPADGLAL